METPEGDTLWLLSMTRWSPGTASLYSEAETRRCQVEAASFAGRATRVPQAAVTSGIQRTATVTPTGPLRWVLAADLDRCHGEKLHGMQGVKSSSACGQTAQLWPG
jgi:hypothetical protein